MKKKILLTSLIILFSLSLIPCTAQSQSDSLLSKTCENIALPDIQKLIDRGYIKETDKQIIANYLVNATNKGINIKKLTISQLIDTVAEIKNKFNSEIAIKNNFGKDSFYFRLPNGEKLFAGLGELSFEKLIDRESRHLPDKYDGDYNLLIDGSEKFTSAFIELIKNNDLTMIIGNVMLIEKEKGVINQLKIGDVFEIAKRVKNSKEFAPFAEIMK